jgi:MFS family permease
MPDFQPSKTLFTRTFCGLLLAQFLAAFNDQAIHASAMFYAIAHGHMTANTAISLMPVLFYAPWAIFCTLAGYMADRFSKRSSLVAWKVVEIAITLVALGGFWLGTEHRSWLGPIVVLSAVFLMGTHSAFFVPAKYGIMPEILEPQLLSKGNGILESTSFLAVILGTVSGGLLSSYFKHREPYIALVLFVLAVVGAVGSLLIRPVPAADPTRPFPRDLIQPLVHSLRTLWRSRPLALSMLGIAFFTFMVAFMRATMYMHGESQNPPWPEDKTSLVAATVALGVGLGSPLAGYFSGNKVELGLVPLGAVGMILATLIAALTIFWVPGLIAAIILIGFFSGFYIVPLYTLLQHRAPKASKGELIATSNFINVTGATAASVLFRFLTFAAAAMGVARPVPQQDVASGILADLQFRHGIPAYFAIRQPDDLDGKKKKPFGRPLEKGRVGKIAPGDDTARISLSSDSLNDGDRVKVSAYTVRGVKHFEVRDASVPLSDAYDQEMVPRFLFIGASVMTLGILILLCRQLPDFFVRALLWLRSHGRFRFRVSGTNNLPADGPVILATNCERFQESLQVIAATDRYTRFILLESAADDAPRPILRYLARRTGLVALRAGTIDPETFSKAIARGTRALDAGNLLGITLKTDEMPSEAHQLLNRLQDSKQVPILPIHCARSFTETGSLQPARVVIGDLLPPGTPAHAVQQALDDLAASANGLMDAHEPASSPAMH